MKPLKTLSILFLCIYIVQYKLQQTDAVKKKNFRRARIPVLYQMWYTKRAAASTQLQCLHFAARSFAKWHRGCCMLVCIPYTILLRIALLLLLNE